MVMGAQEKGIATFPGRDQGQRLSCAFGARVTFLLRGQEKSNQKRRPPRLALAGLPARQVREPAPGFSTAHPCAGEKESASCRLPLRGLSTPTHRRTGAPGRAAGHPGPHSWRSLRERRARSGRLSSSWRSSPSVREEVDGAACCPMFPSPAQRGKVPKADGGALDLAFARKGAPISPRIKSGAGSPGSFPRRAGEARGGSASALVSHSSPFVSQATAQSAVTVITLSRIFHHG